MKQSKSISICNHSICSNERKQIQMKNERNANRQDIPFYLISMTYFLKWMNYKNKRKFKKKNSTLKQYLNDQDNTK